MGGAYIFQLLHMDLFFGVIILNNFCHQGSSSIFETPCDIESAQSVEPEGLKSLVHILHEVNLCSTGCFL